MTYFIIVQFKADPNAVSLKGPIKVDHDHDALDNEWSNAIGYPSVEYYLTTIKKFDKIEVIGLGFTPLLLACISGSLQLVKLLVENGADPEQPMGLFDNALSRIEDERSEFEFSISEEIKEYLTSLKTLNQSKSHLKEVVKVLDDLRFIPQTITTEILEYTCNFPLFQTVYRNFVKKPNFIIHVIASKTQMLGDRHHALGLQRALASSYLNPPELREWDPADPHFSIFLEMLQRNTLRHIVIGVGTIGLQHLPTIKKLVTPKEPATAIEPATKETTTDESEKDDRITEERLYNENIFTVWSGHQYLPDLKAKAELLDVIGLPEHDSDLISHPKIISCYGVPHDATPEAMLQKFEQYRKEFLDNKGHVVVILGGDAPDAANQIKKFTPECARAIGTIIGNYVKQHKKDCQVLVTTGPRTQPECVESFASAVIAAGLAENQLKVLEFSKFKGASMAALHFLKHFPHPNHEVFITADSVTMGSAAIETQKQGTVVFVEIDSMNESHKGFMKRCRDLCLCRSLIWHEKSHNDLTILKARTGANSITNIHYSSNLKAINYTYNGKEFFPVAPRKIEEILGTQLRTRIDEVTGLIPKDKTKESIKGKAIVKAKA